jgi:predicted Zn-dependent protease
MIGTKIAEIEGLADRAIQDPQLSEMFNAMVAPLIATAPDYEWRFFIIPDESVNAAALPGGVILIHTGLIDFSENAEELLGVVAHEMVHVQNRHAMKGLVYQLGWTVLRLSVGVQDQMIVDTILRQGNHLSKLSYSRYHEYEADREALALLQQAGLDARGFPTFFLRLKERQLEKGQRQIPITLFDTHPMPQERAEALHRILQDMPRDPRHSSINYDLFKKRVLSTAASQDPKPDFMGPSKDKE